MGFKGSNQRGVRGQNDGADIPTLERISPVAGQVIAGTKIGHEIIAVNISSAIYEDAILRVQLPDQISSPVVVVHDWSGRMLAFHKSDRISGKITRLDFSLTVQYFLNPEPRENSKADKHY